MLNKIASYNKTPKSYYLLLTRRKYRSEIKKQLVNTIQKQFIDVKVHILLLLYYAHMNVVDSVGRFRNGVYGFPRDEATWPHRLHADRICALA